MSPSKSRKPVVLALVCGAIVAFPLMGKAAPEKKAAKPPARAAAAKAAKPAAKLAAAKAATKPAAAKAKAPKKAPAHLLTEDVCVRVVEGDLIEGKKVGLVRLIGVMAPSVGEPGYQEALASTRKLAQGKAIKLDICRLRPNDTKDRLRAVVTLPGGAVLNTRLLYAGRVRFLDKKPCHANINAWKAYEDEAKAKHRGLWATGPSEKPAVRRPRRDSDDESARPKRRARRHPAQGARVRIRRSGD